MSEKISVEVSNVAIRSQSVNEDARRARISATVKFSVKAHPHPFEIDVDAGPANGMNEAVQAATTQLRQIGNAIMDSADQLISQYR
ncbi:MAG TPA: hypothetical protein VI113_08755 [Alphaproteobacteria bacterium]